jgi:hypothetical protein
MTEGLMDCEEICGRQFAEPGRPCQLYPGGGMFGIDRGVDFRSGKLKASHEALTYWSWYPGRYGAPVGYRSGVGTRVDRDLCMPGTIQYEVGRF